MDKIPNIKASDFLQNSKPINPKGFKEVEKGVYVWDKLIKH